MKESVGKLPAGRRSSRIHIGISGWQYAGWRGVFYPEKLPHARELEFASRAVQSIEINGSHYSLQRASSFRRWREATPDGFIFSVKGPRFITHMLRLQGERLATATANFFASGVLELGPKLGPILWQFPARMAFEPEVFESFIANLPTNTDAAAALAKRHDDRVKDPGTTTDRKRPLRHAFEIRHPSYCDETFIRLLRKHGAALVVSDAVADWPYVEDVTAPFVYLRLHGPETLYGGQYSDEALVRWADRIATWTTGGEPPDAQRISKRPPRKRTSRDLFCYFDNDQKVRAPFDAQRLMTCLGQTAAGWVAGRDTPPQRRQDSKVRPRR
jgi:uncharacterized protein YecE (DUF72 family)